MDEHFRAFSFVDRITSVEPGVHIRGRYSVPAGIETFPESLVAEAVGQLAAWSVMSAVEFRLRPVAGLAGKIELMSPVRPGQVLSLEAHLETVDEDAVSYRGSAQVNGTHVIRLEDCVGPMMPMDEFDDPAAVRDRFALLCNDGAAPGAFSGVPSVALEEIRGDPAKRKLATLRVPASAPFFADHFPRRPVFPGTLLMNLNLQLAALLAAEIPSAHGAGWKFQTVSDVKLRAFTPPGEVLECEALVSEHSADRLLIAVETRKGKKTVGGAKVLLSTGPHP